MNERIKRLVDKTVSGEMWVEPVKTDYDSRDLFLSPVKMSGKRVCEYIANQEIMILEESCFTGLMKFDDSVEGDIFNRHGHKNFQIAIENFYNKPVDNLLTFEWQHSVGDFGKIIRRGMSGIKDDIEKSKLFHKDDEAALEFLQTQTDLCNAIIARAKKASQKALEKASETDNAKYRENLKNLSKGLERVPEYPAESFYEAVLCLYFCYPFIPDSISSCVSIRTRLKLSKSGFFFVVRLEIRQYYFALPPRKISFFESFRSEGFFSLIFSSVCGENAANADAFASISTK